MHTRAARHVLAVGLVASGVAAAMVGLAPAVFAAPTDTLYAGQQLNVNQSIVSSDGRFTAIMQSDGNFVVYGPTGATWATGGGSARFIAMQSDGNLVSYTPGGQPTWSSSTATSYGDHLVMQSDGNLVIYSGNGFALWAKGVNIQGGDTLLAGQILNAGQSLVSQGGQYTAAMQSDGNFVLYGPGGAKWASGGGAARFIAMQTDGNLVAYTPGGQPTWSSSTAPSSNDRLVMQSDGNLVIYSSSGAVWSNGQNLGGGQAPTDDYPAKWRNIAQDSVYDSWGEFNRECTSFAAFRLSARFGYNMTFHDNAKYWGNDAAARGVRVDGNPTVGSIAWSSAGQWGHVAWVQAVNGNTITIEDYNSDWHGHWAPHYNVPASTYQYIHFVR